LPVHRSVTGRVRTGPAATSRGVYDYRICGKFRMTEGKGNRALDRAALRNAMVEYQAGRIGRRFEFVYASLARSCDAISARCAGPTRGREDLVQETFLRSMERWHTYAPDRAVLPWALAISRHVFLMDRRSSLRERRREVHRRRDSRARGRPEADRAVERDALEKALPASPSSAASLSSCATSRGFRSMRWHRLASRRRAAKAGRAAAGGFLRKILGGVEDGAREERERN